MNSGRFVLTQILDLIHWQTLSRLVSKYNAESKVRHFGVRQQLICMAFAQLTWRNGLRDIEACLNAKSEALYHLGFLEPVAKSTLADANEKRDWRLWEDLAKSLITRARKLYQGESLGLDLENAVYALDFFDHRFDDVGVSVGQISLNKKRNQTAHAVGLERTDSCLHLHFRCQRQRHKMVGRTDFRTWSHLHHGQGVCRLGKTLSDCDIRGVFCHSGQGQSAFYKIPLATRRQVHGIAQRPNRQVGDCQIERGFPHAFAESSLLRPRKEEALNIPNKQLANSSIDRCKALQKAMGDRIVFQMDQRQLGNQALLRNKRQCGEDTNLDSGVAVFDGGDLSQEPKIAGRSPQYFADFECSPI